MCKAPKPPAPKEPLKPQFLRNKYLDDFTGGAGAVRSLRTGRSQLRIPLSSASDSATGTSVGMAPPPASSNASMNVISPLAGREGPRRFRPSPQALSR